MGGRAAAVVLRGAPGMGKSTLLDELVAGATGCIVLQARGSSGDADVSFGGLLELLRPCADRLGEVPGGDALASAVGLADPSPADRFSVGAALLQLLGHIAEETPVVVAVDDLQWLDASSRDALLFGTRRLRDDRVLVLMTMRPDGAPDLNGFDVIDVEPLSLDDATSVLRASNRRWADVAASEVARRCAGHPLVLTEVAARVTERQRLGLDPLNDALPLGPSSIDLYRPAVDALDDVTRLALMVVAMIPDVESVSIAESFRLEQLGAVAWEAAERHRLVRLRGTTVALAHPVVGGVVLELAAPDERRRAHRIAAAMSTEPERAAWHRSEATIGSDDELAVELEGWAFAALQRGDTAHAEAMIARAAEVTGAVDEAAQRALLAAQFGAMRGSDVSQYLRAAERGTASTRAEAAVVDAAVRGWSGRPSRFDLDRSAVVDLERDHPVAAALVRSFAAITAFAELRLADADELAARAFELVDRRRDVEHPFGLMPYVGQAVYGYCAAGRGAEEFAECIAEISRRGLVDLAPPVLYAASCVRDITEVIEDFGRSSHEVALAQGNLPALTWISTGRGMVALSRGDLHSAELFANAGLELARDLGLVFAQGQAVTLLAMVGALRGDAGAVDAAENDFAVLPPGVSNAVSETLLRFARARLAAVVGDLSEAADLLGRIDPASDTMEGFWPVTTELVETLGRLDRVEEGRQYLPVLDRLAGHRSLGQLGEIDRARASLTDGADALELLESSAAHLEGNGKSLELARTRLALGERLRRLGRRREARTQLSAALTTFDYQECEPWAARCRAELRASGADVDRTGDTATHLTPQESQVVAAVATGRSNRDAAAVLFLSPKTVEMHLTRIYRKLGLRSRAELVAWAARDEAALRPRS